MAARSTSWVVDRGTRYEAVAKRCGVCGVVRYDRPGVRSSCPYKTLHRAASERGVALV